MRVRIAGDIAFGLALAGINFFAIMFGFAGYLVLRPFKQLSVQVPVAVVLSVVLFPLFCRMVWAETGGRYQHETGQSCFAVYIASLVAAAAVFRSATLRYARQGDLTASGNLINLLLFQAPTNALAVLIAAPTLHRRKPRPPGYCQACGYNLQCLPEDRCPECFTPASEVQRPDA